MKGNCTLVLLLSYYTYICFPTKAKVQMLHSIWTGENIDDPVQKKESGSAEGQQVDMTALESQNNEPDCV